MNIFSSSDPFLRKVLLLICIFFALSFILLCTVGYFEYVHPSFFSFEESDTENVVFNSERDVDEKVALSEEEGDKIHKGLVEAGSTAGKMLQEWMPLEEVHSLVAACTPVYSLQNLRAGQPFTVFKTDGQLSRFEYEIDDSQKLIVCREAEAFTASVEEIAYDIMLEKVHGVIDDSLFRTMASLSESPILAEKIANIFQWEINFIRDIQPGDNFTLLVEKKYRNGEFKGYGKLLAAEFYNQGKRFDAFLFTDSFGNVEYYSSTGDSLKRAFLKAPLSFSRITSGFTNRRFHPVLKEWKAHPAIDYAAPTGTPVKAVGHGQAIFVGTGKGAGNYITIKHAQGYESMYLHLSGFAKGLQKGSEVKQGQVIGYVGSTGYSTGPHLDFRVKKNGEFINPEKALSPRTEPVTGARLTEFKKKRDAWRQYLDGKKSLTEYALGKK